MHERLEIGQDLGFQRRERRVLRLGWSLLVMFLLLAALGLLGPGPVTSTTVADADGRLEVGFHRFGHRLADTNMRVNVASDLAQNDQFQLDIDREFALGIDIQEITPPPDSVAVVDGSFRYSFAQRDDDADLAVRISYRPTDYWKLTGTLSVPNGPSVDLWIFTYF